MPQKITSSSSANSTSSRLRKVISRGFLRTPALSTTTSQFRQNFGFDWISDWILIASSLSAYRISVKETTDKTTYYVYIHYSIFWMIEFIKFEEIKSLLVDETVHGGLLSAECNLRLALGVFITSGEGLLLISYEGGTAIFRRSAIAEITPPIFSAACPSNVKVTDTYNTQ